MNEAPKVRAPASDPRMGEWSRRLIALNGDRDHFLEERSREGISLTDGAKNSLRG